MDSGSRSVSPRCAPRWSFGARTAAEQLRLGDQRQALAGVAAAATKPSSIGSTASPRRSAELVELGKAVERLRAERRNAASVVRRTSRRPVVSAANSTRPRNASRKSSKVAARLPGRVRGCAGRWRLAGELVAPCDGVASDSGSNTVMQPSSLARNSSGAKNSSSRIEHRALHVVAALLPALARAPRQVLGRFLDALLQHQQRAVAADSRAGTRSAAWNSGRYCSRPWGSTPSRRSW